MDQQPIDSDLFMRLVRPGLERRDAEAVAEVVKSRWSKEQLCDLIQHGSLDARKVCCLTIGLVGCKGCADCLVQALKDPDEMVVEMAEQAMWSIWFRVGSEAAQPHFARGIEMMEAGNFTESIKALNRASMVDPEFAEAHNQRGIAFYLLEDWKRSLEASKRALELEPRHFGALAGMGHCYAQAGHLVDAAKCYRKALRIHPRMRPIRNALDRISQKLELPKPGQTGAFPAIA